MRQDRMAVYLGAVGALALMTVLSAGMGYALPNLIPKEYTHFASALLFLYFGCRLLKDASEIEGSGVSDELQEVRRGCAVVQLVLVSCSGTINRCTAGTCGMLLGWAWWVRL